jgi:coenzyme F420-0:L-glutamate ligase/coenzyme F420-1:gamma-L-glutamate ligase
VGGLSKVRAGPVPPRYEVIGIEGVPEVEPGDDIARLIVEAAARQSTPLAGGDLLVVGQKIVSKAEGRLVRLADVTPSPVAESMAAGLGRDPRLVEVILRESRRVVRMDQGVLITETHHGWVCANAGVDQSNVERDCVALLPEDPDRSARMLRDRIRALTGAEVAVIVADTFGRPWREGLTNVAIGVAGLAPIRSYLGERDPAGRPLQATILAVADELAAAAEPVMGKLDRIPAAIVRGLRLAPGEEGSKPLLRDPARDLFR